MIPLVAPTIEQDDLDVLMKYMHPEELVQAPARLERLLSQKLNRKFARAVNSGTSALHLSLMALEVAEGDEVLCPAYTCTSVLNSILYVKAKPVFVDCNSHFREADFSMNLDDVTAKITPRTKAILFTHMFGKATEIQPYLDLGIPVIEDGTLSLGAVSESGAAVGALGDLAVFSLHESKMISGIAGGIVLTDREEWVRELDNRLENNHHSKSFAVRYTYNMPNLNAALACNQLSKLSGFLAERRRLAAYYSERLLPYSDLIQLPDITDDHVYFRYIISLNGVAAPAAALKAFEQKGIQFGRGVYPPLHQYKGESDWLLPHTDQVVGEALSIPLHPSLSQADADYIMDTFIDMISVWKGKQS